MTRPSAQECLGGRHGGKRTAEGVANGVCRRPRSGKPLFITLSPARRADFLFRARTQGVHVADAAASTLRFLLCLAMDRARAAVLYYKSLRFRRTTANSRITRALSSQPFEHPRLNKAPPYSGTCPVWKRTDRRTCGGRSIKRRPAADIQDPPVQNRCLAHLLYPHL
jgi:hypothetical protein